MKAWTVLAVQHDGELVCWDCMTEREVLSARDEVPDDEISPLFASAVEGEEVCDRCHQVIEGTEGDDHDNEN